MAKIQYSLHHASMLVSNTQESLKFYVDTLGMEQANRPKLAFPGAWLKLGECQIHLLELPSPDPKTGRPPHGGRDRHVAVTVADITPIRKRLDDAGVAYTLSISGREALFCRDPDGNAIEIIADVEIANMANA